MDLEENLDYSADGAFGRVRSLSMLNRAEDMASLYCISSAGWHRVNSAYHIRRGRGGLHIPLLLLTVSGEGRLRMGGTEHRLLPGAAALVPAGMAHAYFAPEGGRWEFYWLHPEGAAAAGMAARLWNRLEGGFPFFCGDMGEIGRRMEELLLLEGEREPVLALSVSRLVSDILHRLLLEAEAGREPSRAEGLTEAARRYMEANFSRRLTLEELGRTLYVSPEHLIRLFRRETGITPHEYLNRLRLARADQLLRFTRLPVEEVAARVGFRQSSHFIALYKKLYGATPGAARGIAETGED